MHNFDFNFEGINFRSAGPHGKEREFCACEFCVLILFVFVEVDFVWIFVCVVISSTLDWRLVWGKGGGMVKIG